jgi:hypothetical protein
MYSIDFSLNNKDLINIKEELGKVKLRNNHLKDYRPDSLLSSIL